MEENGNNVGNESNGRNGEVVGTIKPPVLSQLEQALTNAKTLDHDLEGALGQFLDRPSGEVADKVIEALYEKNGEGVPYFVEKIAHRLGVDPTKLDRDAVDKLIGEYGVVRETLKTIIASKDKFDAATVSQITTQLATQLAADLMKGIPGQVANLAYKDMGRAKWVAIEMEMYLRGPQAAANLERQLINVATPDRLQAIVAGITDGAYRSIKEATPNLYRPAEYAPVQKAA